MENNEAYGFIGHKTGEVKRNVTINLEHINPVQDQTDIEDTII